MNQTEQEVEDLLPTRCMPVLREQFAALDELMTGPGRRAFLTLSNEARQELEALRLKLANGLVACCCEEAREKSVCGTPEYDGWRCPHMEAIGMAWAGAENHTL